MIGAASDQRRVTVDHAVPHDACIVVLGVCGLDDLTMETRLQIGNYDRIQDVVLLAHGMTPSGGYRDLNILITSGILAFRQHSCKRPA
jgi:hypothetical protein